MSIAPWWCAIIIAAKSRSASPLYPVPIDRCIVAIAWFISAANELPLAKAAVEITKATIVTAILLVTVVEKACIAGVALCE